VVAVDVGTVRIGVAASDPRRVLAFPVGTFRRDKKGNTDIDQVADVVLEREATLVVVGLPRTLAGTEGAAVTMARRYAALLARKVAPVPVEMHDERLTTVVAQRGLADAGVRGAVRQRQIIDQAAAVVLLEAVLAGSAR
jgi:putative Holliday junction resolvase